MKLSSVQPVRVPPCSSSQADAYSLLLDGTWGPEWTRHKCQRRAGCRQKKLAETLDKIYTCGAQNQRFSRPLKVSERLSALGRSCETYQKQMGFATHWNPLDLAQPVVWTHEPKNANGGLCGWNKRCVFSVPWALFAPQIFEAPTAIFLAS